ncbi:hypothetical protein DOY81_000345 [Sarcophaga bullata]|nr:hypothetical protein DOY81_000345 [Sarcophaga bullata]
MIYNLNLMLLKMGYLPSPQLPNTSSVVKSKRATPPKLLTLA